MYCGHCGKEIPDNAAFCAHCGLPTGNNSKKSALDNQKSLDKNTVLNGANNFAKRFIPVKILKKFPAVMPITLVTAFAATLIVVFVIVYGAVNAFSHDLSGTYWTGDFFPIGQITFQPDGKFTAYSYPGFTGYSETYQGKYSKNFDGEYTLRFTSGSVNGGSPVTQYEVSETGKQYELSVMKISENTLQVRIVPKLDYFAWRNTTVYFYK